MSLSNKASWFMDPRRRPYLKKRSSLIELFAITEHEKVSGIGANKSLDIGSYLPQSDLDYDVETVRDEFARDIKNYNFVFNGADYLNIYLGVLSNTFKVGDVIITNRLDTYKIIKEETLTDSTHEFIEMNHPGYQFFPDKDKSFATDTYQLLTLKKRKNTREYLGYVLIEDDVNIYAVDHYANESKRFIVVGKVGQPVIRPRDELVVSVGDIDSVPEGSIVSTYGRYVYNYVCISSIFKDKVLFINTPIKNVEEVESKLVPLLQTNIVTAAQGREYMNNSFFLGSLGELFVPVFSRRSLTTNPKVNEIRAQLIKENKDSLDDPVTISKIEDALIKMDKEWMAGDVSMGFYGDVGKKFDIHRKKMYLTGGLVEKFGESGEYDFIKTSLSDGWNVDTFVPIANEIRKGSFDRGKETMKGGVLSKSLLRLFQNIKITSDDCKTKDYLNLKITDDNYKFYTYRWISVGNRLVLLTNENIKNYIGQDVLMRSVQFCKQPDGYCYTCAGEIFKNIDIKSIGVLPLELGSAFTKLALKSMHGTKTNSYLLEDLNEFVL